LEIIQKINTLFKGDYHDKKPTYANSECRFAYCGYLKSKNLKQREIATITNFSLGMVKLRLKRHKDFMEFCKDYKSKFEQLLELN
jgi:hypothetical protein